MTNRRNALFHDVHEEEDIARLMSERSSVDVGDPNPTAGAAQSAPADGDLNDHFRVSSPNRNRGRDDGRMRHHRSR